MRKAYINHLATAVPNFDIHRKFVEFGPYLLADRRGRALFSRMAERCQIAHRYSCLKPHPHPDTLDTAGFYRREAFPSTEDRMRLYKKESFGLAVKALDQIETAVVGNVTHIIITTCTGFYAPGLDWQIMKHYGIRPSAERIIIGFMGCYAAINALKAARHIVRSEPDAKVLVLNIELCSLHLRNTGRLDDVLCFLLFADGCTASIVSAEPHGLELRSFHAARLENSEKHITWHVGDSGFAMGLSRRVPDIITQNLAEHLPAMLGGETPGGFRHWAIHPGGRSILDAVGESAGLDEETLLPSRTVLRNYGNMSSPSVMFVLKAIMDRAAVGERGCAIAFGPGISVESLLFEAAP